jgi:hypothetical protein
MAPAYALVMALQGAFVVWPLAITATHCRVGEKGRQSDADQMKRMCRLWKRDSTDSVNILVQISPTPKQLSPRLAVSGTMMVGDQSRSLETATFCSSIDILTDARRLLKPASAAWRSGYPLDCQSPCWKYSIVKRGWKRPLVGVIQHQMGSRSFLPLPYAANWCCAISIDPCDPLPTSPDSTVLCLRIQCLRAMWISAAWRSRSSRNEPFVAEGCVYRNLL